MSINETGHFDADRTEVRGPMGDGGTVADAFHRSGALAEFREEGTRS